jgi:hypothetical protein
VLQAEVVKAQDAAARERDRRADGLEAALRGSSSTSAEASMLRGQLEEARSAGAAALTKAEALGQQLAAAREHARLLEEQLQRHKAQVGTSEGRGL